MQLEPNLHSDLSNAALLKFTVKNRGERFASGMSGSFTGFSDEDIQNLRNVGPSKTGKPQRQPLNRRKVRGLRRIAEDNPLTQTSSDLRNKILNEKLNNSPTEPVHEKTRMDKTAAKSVKPSDTPEEQENCKAIASTGENAVGSLTCNENGNKSPLLERKIDLIEFQARQKLVEEQNRKRTELLAKALAIKTKETQEEAQKLSEVREEFRKLDALLSDDVKILRKQIEMASLDYMEAQKRYYRVEREFLEAKLALHQKLERKEMLTEHLCAIIEKNEERKAEKLNELLTKLNLKTNLTNDTVEEPNATKNEEKHDENKL